MLEWTRGVVTSFKGARPSRASSAWSMRGLVGELAVAEPDQRQDANRR